MQKILATFPLNGRTNRMWIIECYLKFGTMKNNRRDFIKMASMAGLSLASANALYAQQVEIGRAHV